MSENSENIGRPVPPHRSGGGARVAITPGAGRGSLALAAALAMAGVEILPANPTRRQYSHTDQCGLGKGKPDSRGRRAEKDAAALAKAEAKRQRKAAKRAKEIEQC